ncbi:indolepyruvate ferredoxin oxidoreductase subunit alpha [Sulfitobacter sabulilitoris]|uniref:Indolepyruvate ferredoxin oxidoreductase subunit alpha n=1 Tax=Sulfitobacter sabulilitoris TaxID=2562655 RepID=A0A5S3PD54_9RHOB|nr:indolepyruvate ferredoxin oxidoreductase subunit alpha [Sulfitobacter sabulilitoris]TMM49309.1 indolepyruvate ferredoxin oxidoreductase subunit alpha [Sulfitobacter sabulilitoris]
MAERSFKKEVQMLRYGAGDVFAGEGILAITKALLQSGVGYVGGYQGAPISHLMDVLADSQEILGELGVHYEASASEATATAMLAASVNYPIRGAVAFKSTVGTNVASDALANLASGGVTGGALLIVGEDYGEGSSIMQERSHAFCMKSQVWMLDPRPDLPSIVEAVEHGFQLSEASNTPVMLQVRIRCCHVTGAFTAKDNIRPPMTVKDALDAPKRDLDRIVLPPASYLHEQDKINKRMPAAIQYVKEHRLNERFGAGTGKVGIVCQGGMYNGVVRALQRLGLADDYGEGDVDIYCLNVTYPLIEDEFLAFCKGKDAVLMVEEGQPDYIAQAFGAMLHRAGARTRLLGKDLLPMAGEYTGQVMLDGLRRFFRDHAPDLLSAQDIAPNAAPVPTELAGLADVVPGRPPGFCTGCPERPIMAATKLVEQELGQHHISSDIGCHLFQIMPPFNLGATTMGYGLGPASASAFNDSAANRRSISFIGDGGFWHNGLTSSIGNAVFNQNDGVIIIVDNYYSAATGGQDVLSSRAFNRTKSTNHPIEKAVRGMGVNWVRQIDRTYDVARVRDTLKEALTTAETGPKVIIASSECMLNKQRREKPQRAKAMADGKRMVVPKFGIDDEICTGDHACIRLSGCPSLTLKYTGDPLRDDPIAHIDETCVGCGNCGEVADAAVLCPSFYQADRVVNPTGFDRWKDRLRSAWRSRLQSHRDASRLQYARG